ncbi:MAG: DUF624 domain-containing protein [Oscillibacter sp.]|nr:DUF624 domain-containing protein [Oscillibacter sp.]
MSKLFSYDSPVISFLNTVADIFFVNLLFLLTCLPVFTIGAALSALYTVGACWAEKKDAGVAKYWSTFRSDFRGSILPWVILLVTGLFLAAGAYITFLNPTPMQIPCLIFLGLLALVYLLIDAQLFPFFSRFNCTLRQLFANALLTALAHPLRTIVLIALKHLPLVLFMTLPNLFFRLLPVWMLGYASFCGYLAALLMRAPFRRYAEQVGGPDGNSR